MASTVIAPPTTQSGAGARLQHYLAGSPGRLRRIGAAAVLSVILIAFAGAGSLVLVGQALDESGAAFDHLELIQSARTDLLQADADATSAFLTGGLEPTDQRRRYLASIASASISVAMAANSGPRDSRYAVVMDGLVDYSGYIETARSMNRQALPVGANYLRIGSALLQTDVLNPLAQLAEMDSERAARGFSAASRAAVGFAVCAVIGLVGLVWSQRRLALLTRSVFTLPAAVTSAVLLGVMMVTALLVILSVRQTTSVRDGDSARTAALVQARASAFEAKAKESLTLISRGSLPTGETLWKGAMAESRNQAGRVDAKLVATLDSYAKGHATLHQLDVDGKWADAVKLAVGEGGTAAAPTATEVAFSAFDRDSANLLSEAIEATADGLGSARGGLAPAAVALVVGGLIAAAGVGRGIASRLGEYR